MITYLYKQRQAQAQGKVNNCIHLDIEILALNVLDILIQTLLIIIERNGSAVVSFSLTARFQKLYENLRTICNL